MKSYTIQDGWRWRSMYESGLSFEQVALKDDANIDSVKRWAKRAGLVSRSSGGRCWSDYSGPRAFVRDGVRGKSSPVIHKSSMMKLRKARRGRFSP